MNRLQKPVLQRIIHYELSCSYCEATTNISVCGLSSAGIFEAVEAVSWSMPKIGTKGNWFTGKRSRYEVRCPRHTA